jgi:hypothetical protein
MQLNQVNTPNMHFKMTESKKLLINDGLSLFSKRWKREFWNFSIWRGRKRSNRSKKNGLARFGLFPQRKKFLYESDSYQILVT